MENRRWRAILILFLVLLFSLALAAGVTVVLATGSALAPQAPAAALVYVRTGGDDANCDGTVNIDYPGGGPTSCAFATVDNAVFEVDADGTVVVAAGVYGENVYIGKNVTLQGAGAGSTIIDGGGAGSTIRVYQYLSVTISGMTVRNGSGTSGQGGGILVERDGTVQVTDVTLFDNRATNGGGMYLGLNSVVAITNCTVISNSAGQRGGGIHSAAPNGTLTIVNSTVTDNYAGWDGGGVWQNAGTLTVDGSSIIDNAVAGNGPFGTGNGGGIGKSNGAMLISKSDIVSNTAVNAGGGIYQLDCTVAIEDTTVRGNQLSHTDSIGGGIFSDGETTLTNVAVVGNASLDDGGGIHSQDLMTLTNVTVSGNASGYGGGIFHGGATMTAVNCTVASNTASAVGGTGGIRLYGPVTLRNTLLAQNEDANCFVGTGGSAASLGYNLEDVDSCGLDAATDMTTTVPMLASLQDNGGDTWTHRLRSGSPAIDAIPKASCAVAFDQRGVLRPVDGDEDSVAACDIGAYEFNLLNRVYLPLVLKNY